MNLRTNLAVIDGMPHVVPTLGKPLAVMGESALREAVNHLVSRLQAGFFK